MARGELESNEDGTVYTFRLRENAFWHDGEPLTAEDVAFTFAYYRKHLPVYGRLRRAGSTSSRTRGRWTPARSR